jgi:hypothetical protein
MAPPELVPVEVDVEPAAAQLQPLSELATGVSAAPLSPDGSSPASTEVAVHVVSEPVAGSPAGRVVPGAHATQAWLATD